MNENNFWAFIRKSSCWVSVSTKNWCAVFWSWLQLLHQLGIDLGPHWPEAKHLKNNLQWQLTFLKCGVQATPQGSPKASRLLSKVLWAGYIGATMENCRHWLQFLHQPGIEPGPHWPEAKHLTTKLQWQLTPGKCGVQAPPQYSILHFFKHI